MSLFSKLNEVLDPTPHPDMCKCSECGWEGPVHECPTEQEGDWESGYYDIDVCPKCEDGGCIEDYWFFKEEEDVT